ncbi:MAG TPA: alkaline phosphatase family protein [Candidatus Limnocylindrales bacterium]|nr:alkaline phosphatase family protein [Candidatus Limnocylindrales bacterium]
MARRLRRVLAVAVGLLTVMGLTMVQAGAEGSEGGRPNSPLGEINHLVIIYEENHSFDNLYGGWEGVNGLSRAPDSRMDQLSQAGVEYSCLLQTDVNLVSPPLPAGCNFANEPFNIGSFIPATALTCPQPGAFYAHGTLPNAANLPGGCTQDIVHRFYQEQYQINNGKQNLYVTGSDAAGLAMGYYDTTTLPIYAYLHGEDHPSYAIQDNFFQSAFGGSFLNHQWLIAAASPQWVGAPAANHSIIDSNGMPNGTYPLYTPTGPVLDRQLTQVCPSAVANRACGDYAINTIQPGQQPFKGSPQLPLQTGKTIGDELTAANVSWAWYSGGWSNANGDSGAPGWTNGTTFGVCSDPNSSPNGTNGTIWYCPNKVFQFHHQPFNYYANYAPGTPGRTHLQDEQVFMNLAGASTGEDSQCQLPSVSFVKPIGLENEHPGYTSETEGSNHLVSLLKSINNSSCARDTMVLVTYDEFGGQWDHVAPPGQGGKRGPHDVWGPGTRIPALVIAPELRGDFVVDHTQYDTTSFLATIEHRFGVAALGTRDAAVNDLGHVFRAQPQHESD